MTYHSLPICITLLTTANLTAALVIDGQPDPNNPLLAVWFDANDPASQTALATGVWPDRSQNGNDAFAVGGGFLTDIGDGLSAVSFNQTSGFYEFSKIPLMESGFGSASIFIVTSTIGAPGGFGNPQIAMGDSFGNEALVFFELAPHGNAIAFRGPEGGTLFETPDFTFTPISISHVGMDGSDFASVIDLSINGIERVPILGSNSPIGSYGLSTIGFHDGRNWNGEIAEILIFQEQLTPAEEFQITSYLGNKYGVLIPEPTVMASTMLGMIALVLRRRV